MDEIPEMLKGIFKQLEKLDQLPNMSKEIRSLSDRISAIDDSVLTYRRELDQVKKKQNDLDHEIHILRSLPQRDERLINVEERLELYVRDIHETLEYHQRYIESVDNQLRGKNLIFHGVPENPSDEWGLDDTEKVKNVIQKTGHSNMADVDNISTTRLGETRDNLDKPRPILVKVDNHALQKQLIMRAKQLRNKIGCSHIYIKKDLHYTIRKELNRLKRREMQEKDDPRNDGVDIKFNWKERLLTINDMVIDKFKPSF